MPTQLEGVDDTQQVFRLTAGKLASRFIDYQLKWNEFRAAATSGFQGGPTSWWEYRWLSLSFQHHAQRLSLATDAYLMTAGRIEEVGAGSRF